jgi:hypothetical protein
MLLMKGRMEPMGHLEHAAIFDLLETRDHLEQVFCNHCIGLYGDGATVIPNVSFVMSEADRSFTSGDTFTSISRQQCQ